MGMNIKLLVMDVDGTLTDGRIYMGPGGEALKSFNIKDGYGIVHLLPVMGIEPVIITGRKSLILNKRCEELGITRLYQGIKNKIEILNGILDEIGCTYEQVAYIGDDLNDLECMQLAAISGCPADAVPEVKEKVSYISEYNGGAGAVRDFICWLAKKADLYLGSQ